jgi:branched-chain amino acid transport system substrate-binding protein
MGGTVTEGVRYDPDIADYSADIKVLGARAKEASDRYGSENIGVYLVSFDEAVPIMALGARDPVLSSVRWFGSDGMAELPSLVENESAAQFAAENEFIALYFHVMITGYTQVQCVRKR